MTRAALLIVAVAVLLPASAAAHTPPPPQPAPGCPTRVDRATFAGADKLYADNKVMSDLGPRPTASPAHRRYVSSLEQRLRAMPGVEFREIPYSVQRRTETKVQLFARAPGGRRETVRVSSPVPYGAATPRKGIDGPLVFVDAGTPLDGLDLRGKIVVREAATGSVPKAAFAALEWFSYDPELVLTRQVLGNYERDYLGGAKRIADLAAAAKAGAAALILTHEFPHEQVRGHYAPYEGVAWGVPAIYVGVDEGERLEQLASARGRARVRVDVAVKRAPTRTLIARLPGRSAERIVVQSHTDGINAVWDNGPVAMLSMAEHFAHMERACRPRTLEFVFTTGHLFLHLVEGQRGGGAEQYARELDRDYDRGTVAMVLALEHLGALEYEARPRGAGKPGSVLAPTGRAEPTSVFIGESPLLVEQVALSVTRHDLRETIALRGADLPGLHFPPHYDFGGEGGPYHGHLIPTVALVEGPWSLYNPAFGLEAVDRGLLRRQTMVFTDVVHAAAPVPRELLGGVYTVERELRKLICGSALAAFGLARCDGTPTARSLGGLPRNLGTSR